MTYVKIGEAMYPAIVTSTKAGYEWGRRNIKALKLEMDFATAIELFVDDLSWGVVYETEESTTEYSCSDYCLAGPITDNRDGTVTVKMGALTDAELLAIMMGGN